MGNNLYSFIVLVAFIVLIVLIRCNNQINADSSESIEFRRTMMCIGVFLFFDGFWGLTDSGFLGNGSRLLEVNSFFFHLFATVTAYVWYAYTCTLLRFDDKLIRRIVDTIPLIAGVALLTCQIFSPVIYSITIDAKYHTGPYRHALFLIQLFYFIYALWRVILNRNRKRFGVGKREYRTGVYYLSAVIVTTILQTAFPYAPYTSAGYLLASIILFDGSMVIERERITNELSMYRKRQSEENYKALEALANQFSSIHVIDLKNGTQHPVKSMPAIDFFIDPNESIQTQFDCVMSGTSDKTCREDMLNFVNLDTLQMRLRDTRAINREFLGVDHKYSMSSFIKVSEDKEGNLEKVIHAVQNIDDVKRKELELQQAITRAYENKNAIYAELLRMQSTGVIATDEKEYIILANEMATEMFGRKDEDVVGMTYEKFVNQAQYLDIEKAYLDYHSLEEEGKAITYCMMIPTENGDRYLKADARRLSLLDGKRVVLTCFTDITESKNIEDALRILSETDGLTGIDNRRSGESKITLMLNEHVPGVFCLIDVNKFKSINDTYGHQTGDKALISIANALKEAFRENDITMRIGGDEFAVFIRNIKSKATAVSKFRSLFEIIGKIDIEEMQDDKISISLGATFVTEGEDLSFDDIYKRADSVMYNCKAKEGSNYEFY